MEKLPVTSYVRLVDIWLIVGQLIPFLEVIFKLIHTFNNLKYWKVVLFTIVEFYNDDDSINHHGFERKIEANTENRLFQNTNIKEVQMDIGKIAKTIGNLRTQIMNNFKFGLFIPDFREKPNVELFPPNTN